jgi:hypothetical protein
MVIFAIGVMPDLENHGTEAPAAPANCAELLRIVFLPVDQVGLAKNLLRLLPADAVFLLEGLTLRLSNSTRMAVYNGYISSPKRVIECFLWPPARPK